MSIERVSFTVHLYQDHGQVVVSRAARPKDLAKIITTRRLPGVRAGATPQAVLDAVFEALGNKPPA